MGEVLSFPASGQTGEQRRGEFFDRDLWRVSRRGNPYIRTVDGFCVTVFPAWNGFRYAIARSAGERPMFSERIFDTEDEARRAAWSALSGLVQESA
jgi:hypothetical protein